MFSFDINKQKEHNEIEKAKIRQKKIDNMLKEYDQMKAKEEKIKHKKLSGKPKINFKLPNTGNEHGNRFIKCMIPPAIIIGGGCLFWGLGFAVKELSKVASFLNGISLPESFTNVIATSAFWKVVGIVAAICALVFIVLTMVSIAQNSLSAKSFAKNKNIEKSKQKQIQTSYSIEASNDISKNNSKNNEYIAQYKDIKYNKNINKTSYNEAFSINQQYMDNATKNIIADSNIDIQDRNKQIVSQGNNKNFDIKDKQVLQNINKDKKDYYNENISLIKDNQ